MNFSSNQYEQIMHNYSLIDTINAPERKGVPQAKYVIEIRDGDYWCGDSNKMKTIDGDLVGFWILESEVDPYWYGIDECLKEDAWVRAKEVTVTTWVADYEV